MDLPKPKAARGWATVEAMEEVTTMDAKTLGYLQSSTFWVLMVSGPTLWALVIYLGLQLFLPHIR